MTDLKTKKSIVIYFSRADENYGVWYIEKWNTEVIAEYIQELAWADLFKVERKTPYAKDYATCIKEAQEEIDNDERPEIVNSLESIDDYFYFQTKNTKIGVICTSIFVFYFIFYHAYSINLYHMIIDYAIYMKKSRSLSLGRN